MIKHIIIFFIFIYSNSVSISQEAFNKLWGSPENYCNYCLSTMSNEELELLKLLSDENGIIYFNIYLETGTLQIPVYVKDLFKEPDLLEFINTVTTQLSSFAKASSFAEASEDTSADKEEQNMYDDEM